MERLWNPKGQLTARGQVVSKVFGKLLVGFLKAHASSGYETLDLENLMLHEVSFRCSMRRLDLLGKPGRKGKRKPKPKSKSDGKVT
jgi:hypothetical protein